MFINTKTGKEVSQEELVETADSYDVIIFGEKHDSKDCHLAELALLKGLSGKYNIIFSMEMFERDVQGVLDEYLMGKITEEEFLRKSRPWNNYKDDYRPQVEYCKTNNIPVLASNVPRYIASKVAKNGPGVLKSLSLKERNFVADTVFFENPEYRERFYNTMAHINMPGFTSSMRENYYRAQCLKDATMAESIIRALENKNGHKVFHINGSFHSDYHLGVVWQISKMAPQVKVLVIAPVEKGEKYDENIGDFVFYYEK